MNKFIISSMTSMILMQAPTLNARVMCERSFSENLQIDLNIIGTSDQGTLEGEFDTNDEFNCGDQIYLRGMYSRLSDTSWHFFFATAEGESGACSTFFFDGVWEGSQAIDGTIYTANGGSFGTMDLSLGVCEFIFIPPVIIPTPPIGPVIVDP